MATILPDTFYSHDSLFWPPLDPLSNVELYYDPIPANPEAIRFADFVFSETVENSILPDDSSSEEFANLNKQTSVIDAEIATVYRRFEESSLLRPPSLLGENGISPSVTVEPVSSSNHSSSANSAAFTSRSTSEETKSNADNRKRKSSVSEEDVSKDRSNRKKITRLSSNANKKSGSSSTTCVNKTEKISASSQPQESETIKLKAEDIEELRRLCQLHTTRSVNAPRRDIQAIRQDFFKGTRQQLWQLFQPKEGQRLTINFSNFLNRHIYNLDKLNGYRSKSKKFDGYISSSKATDADSADSESEKTILKLFNKEDLQVLKEICDLHTTGSTSAPKRDIQAIRLDFFWGERQALWPLFASKDGINTIANKRFSNFLKWHIFSPHLPSKSKIKSNKIAPGALDESGDEIQLSTEDMNELQRLCKSHTFGPSDAPRRNIQVIKEEFFVGKRQILWKLFTPKKGQKSSADALFRAFLRKKRFAVK